MSRTAAADSRRRSWRTVTLSERFCATLTEAEQHRGARRSVTADIAASEVTTRHHRWATPTSALVLGVSTLVLLIGSVPLSVAAHQFLGGLTLLPLMAPFAIVG